MPPLDFDSGPLGNSTAMEYLSTVMEATMADVVEALTDRPDSRRALAAIELLHVLHTETGAMPLPEPAQILAWANDFGRLDAEHDWEDRAERARAAAESFNKLYVLCCEFWGMPKPDGAITIVHGELSAPRLKRHLPRLEAR